MRYLVPFMLLALTSIPALADDVSMTNYCIWKATIAQAVKNDLDGGKTMRVAIADDINSMTSSDWFKAFSPELQEAYLSNIKEMIASIYNQPTVQAQVWFGWELAQCEMSPPASPLIIIPAPKD